MGTYTSADLFKGIALVPGDYLLENLKTVADSSFGKFYINNLVSSTAATVIGTLTSAMAGFA